MKKLMCEIVVSRLLPMKKIFKKGKKKEIKK